jgi:hypothetical protein
LTARLPVLFAALMVGVGGTAAAQPEFVHSVPVRNATAELHIAFHALGEGEGIVDCTAEQREWISKRGVEHLTTISPALAARVVSRKDPAGTVIAVDLDAACYEGGMMGLGGFGRGKEAILMPYEESTLGGEWGPAENPPPSEAIN